MKTLARRPSLSVRMLDWVMAHIARSYAGLWHRCIRSGPKPNIPPGSLIISNHPCHADAAFLMAAAERRICFLHAREYYDVFLLRHFFHLCGCIPVSRGRPDTGAIRLALDLLERGAVVGIFPEGDVTEPGAQLMRPGRHGAALLALRSEAAIIPAFIAGGEARGVLTDWLRPAGGVRVTFGPPISVAAYRGLSITRDRLHVVTQFLMQRIEELRPRPAASTSSPG